ncbi:hypothetical protein VB711_22375 [Cronbergia sp. UHCC 0137]|uniref:hypothetical protein n=1 Tax=Cronbergia sp. UHCC 0137 TaxID=3110239 RepID=UPI002B1EBB96|nr:hypothetical protein [Cronbergia sp. UHCC 0137]MEA5620563.1 hypothetical protein [Cronbergia sp. UHCC 0137]
MSKLIQATFIATALLLAPANYSQAGTCASNCGAKPLQFKPGQYIRVEIVNRTSSLVNLEQFPEMRQISLEPGQQFKFHQAGGTKSNFSMVFWNHGGTSLKAAVSKPNFGTLRVEIKPGNIYPGDRSVYILNDGRVSVF